MNSSCKDALTALGNFLLREEEAALHLPTHLADLPGGVLFAPIQARHEYPGCMIDRDALGDSNAFLTP